MHERRRDSSSESLHDAVQQRHGWVRGGGRADVGVYGARPSGDGGHGERGGVGGGDAVAFRRRRRRDDRLTDDGLYFVRLPVVRVRPRIDARGVPADAPAAERRGDPVRYFIPWRPWRLW